MRIFMGFLPFVLFAVLNERIGPAAALAAGALVAAILLIKDRRDGFELNILEAGTLVLFAIVAAVLATTGGTMSIFAVRLIVDSGLLLIVLISMALGRPFTMQYARRDVPQLLWSHPRFIRANYVITGAWALAFLVMAVAEAAVVFMPGVPAQAGVAAVVIALAGAVMFTRWYSDFVRRRQ